MEKLEPIAFLEPALASLTRHNFLPFAGGSILLLLVVMVAEGMGQHLLVRFHWVTSLGMSEGKEAISRVSIGQAIKGNTEGR